MHYLGSGPSSSSLNLGSAAMAMDDDYLYPDEGNQGNTHAKPLIDFFEDNMLEEVCSIESQEEEDLKDVFKVPGKEPSQGGNTANLERNQATS